MWSKKKCDMCGTKCGTTMARVIPDLGRVDCCDSCKNFADGPGNSYAKGGQPAVGPMGGRYRGPAPKPQRR